MTMMSKEELIEQIDSQQETIAALRAKIAQLEEVGAAIDAQIGPVMEKATRIFRENEALRADKDRWDFVEQHPEIGLGSSRPNVRMVGFSPCEDNGWRTSEFRAETYREAVDKARAALTA